MAINVEEISYLIKEQIKGFENEIEVSNDVGTIVTVGDGIVLIYGLEKGMLGELLIFSDGSYGMIMNLEEESVYAILLNNSSTIKEGDKVKRTEKVVEAPVGDALLGRVVNGLGLPLDGKGEIKYNETLPIERVAPGVISRESVNEPLQTGILAIDSLIPIGKGQRELIIGDRQTGKTAIAIDTIINQKGKDVYCIYVAIGQKNSTVASIYEKLKNSGSMDYTVIVNASASEITPLQWLAPFSGVTMAEKWCEEGKNVLIVFDDLSKHAIAYRTLSLLLKRNPGREAYPGDVFYLHSRLLERCVKLNKKRGGGSITALPIIETLAGDISAYIPTNVISITDGQIFLQTSLFNKGQRPAIDVGLSVSRVGSNAQFKAVKKTSSSLKMEISQFHELEAFNQFGSDIDIETKKILKHGAILEEILKQNQYLSLSTSEETIYLFAAKSGLLDDLEVEKVKSFLTSLYKYIKDFNKEIIIEIEEKHDLSQDKFDELKNIILNFKKEQLLNNGN